MWHWLQSRAVLFALMKCACEVSLCQCVCVWWGAMPAFRMRKCVTLWQWINSQSQMFLRKHKTRMPGYILLSVYWTGLMSLLRVLSEEPVTKSKPGTRIHPTVLRTCHSSAILLFLFFWMWDTVALCGPCRHSKDLFPSGRDTEGLCSCHEF